MNETVTTEVCFYPIKPTEKGMIGFSSCLLDGKIALNDIAIYLKPDGNIRLLFPNKYLPNGREVSVYHPINNEVYESIRRAIAGKLQDVKKAVEEKQYGKERSKH